MRNILKSVFAVILPLLVYLSLSLAVSSSQLIFTEVMYKPVSGSAEWIEIYNFNGTTVSLAGWAVSDEDTSGKFAIGGGTLANGGYLVIAEDSSIFGWELPPEAVIIVPQVWRKLNNDGDRLYLFDPAGAITESLVYPGDWGGGEYGVSMERSGLSPGCGDWFPSADPSGGTPGRRNSVYFESSGGGGAEIHAAPEVFTPDGDGLDEETVISYRLTVPYARVNLRVFDVRGRLVRFLMQGVGSGPEGLITWDGRNDEGRRVRLGSYIVHLEAVSEAYGSKLEAKAVVIVGGKL